MKKTLLLVFFIVTNCQIGFSQTNLLWQSTHSWKNVKGKVEVFTTDSKNNTYVAGYCKQGDFYKPVVTKFDSLGGHEWTSIIPLDSFITNPPLARIRATDKLAFHNNKLILSASYSRNDTNSLSGFVASPILAIINTDNGIVMGFHTDSNHYDSHHNSVVKKGSDSSILKVTYATKYNDTTGIKKQYIIQHFDTLANLLEEYVIGSINGFGEAIFTDSSIFIIEMLSNSPSFRARIIESSYSGVIINDILTPNFFSSNYNGANPFHFSKDDFNNFYIGGNCFKSGGIMEYYFGKFNSSGNMIFAKTLPDFAYIYSNEGSAQILSGNDNSTFLISPFNNSLIPKISKFNDSGSLLWETRLNNSSPNQYKGILNNKNQISLFVHTDSNSLGLKIFSQNGDSIFYSDFASSQGLNLINIIAVDSNYIYTLEANSDSFVVSRFYSSAILTSIKSQFKNNKRPLAFPNPADMFINISIDNIESKQLKEEHLEIRNILGESLSLPWKIIENKLQIKTSSLPDGVYYYTIKLRGVNYNNSFIVRHK